MVSPAIAQPAPVPPPVAQRGADCARPQYASDILVCGDSALRAMDSEVAALAKTPLLLADGALWEDQSAWIRRRSLCAFQADHRACLAAAYADRRTVLIAANTMPNRPLRCDGGWRGRKLLASESAAALVIQSDGRLLSVASVAGPAWQPLIVLRRSGRSIMLRPQSGRPLQCRFG